MSTLLETLDSLGRPHNTEPNHTTGRCSREFLEARSKPVLFLIQPVSSSYDISFTMHRCVCKVRTRDR